ERLVCSICCRWPVSPGLYRPPVRLFEPLGTGNRVIDDIRQTHPCEEVVNGQSGVGPCRAECSELPQYHPGKKPAGEQEQYDDDIPLLLRAVLQQLPV
ncbi:hypothetical protein, partial [Bacillus pumilus]|uniref:hypothetical protein n=1 Tax=Bacillus pumilus TaxID=1408 RepID=UPI001642AD9A